MTHLVTLGLRAIGVASVAAATAVGLALPASASVRAEPVTRTFTTPALAEGTARFVDAAVLDLLGRSSTQADRDRWVPGLDAGRPREAFAGDVARSPEWASVVVTDLYAQVLDRTPDTGGLTYWSTQLAGGMRTVDLAGLLYASPEFYAASGSTTGGYVDRLYLSILHRLPDDGGRAWWIAQLDAGQSRTTLAQLIFLSLEGNGRRVDTLYSRLLNRATDPGGRTYWSNLLISTDDLVLAGLLVGSNEYFDAAQTRYRSATVTTNPGTTVLVAPHVLDLTVDESGAGTVTIAPGGPVPAPRTGLLVSTGGADGFAVGTATTITPDADGTTTVTFDPADLTDVVATADIRSTTELPRDGVTVPSSAPGRPACATGSAELDVTHRLTADVAFDGHLAFDRVTDTYDTTAIVTVSANLTAIMSATGRTTGCARHGDTWSASWPLAIPAGPLDIPLVVDIDGTYDIDATFAAGFRSSASATIPCHVGFTATDHTDPDDVTGCNTLDGRAGAEPGSAGRATDHATLAIDARIGAPHTGVRTSGTLEPAVTTDADLGASPWWTVDLTVDGSASADIALTPWSTSEQWPSRRLADHRLARAADGSTPPPPPTDDPPAVTTQWLRLGAVDQPYAMDLAATGTPGFTWSATGLPAGVTVTGSRLAGAPTVAGTTPVVLTVTDATGRSAVRTVRLTVGAQGSSTTFDRITDGNSISGLPELSDDGRYVVFGSRASDLVPGDDNGEVDVFTFDQATGVLGKLTHGPDLDDTEFGQGSIEPYAISADGRQVVFESTSPSLVPSDDNGVFDVFSWDRVTGATTRISHGNAKSIGPSISADGGRVTFTSAATDLVAGDTNATSDVFLWDRTTATTTRLTGPAGGHEATLSGDAGTVSFHTTGGLQILDLATGTGPLLTGATTSYPADLSFDGGFAAFPSSSSGIRRWVRSTGVASTISDGGFWPPSISNDGGTVVFATRGDSSDTLIQRWEASTGTTSPITTSAVSMFPSVSGDGSTIAFSSTVTTLVPNDTNGTTDVFLWHRPPPPSVGPAVTTGWLRLGAVGAPYSMELAATGGAGAYTWAAAGLPAGLTVSGGRLSGTPTVAGATPVSVTVTDGAGRRATRTIMLTIGARGSSTAFDRLTHGNGNSGLAEVSSDGRYLVFGSIASDLAPGDDNMAVDVFTFDQATGVLIPLTSGNPTMPIGESEDPWSISADGRYVAFDSSSPTIVAGDGNGVSDVFLWDRTTGTTTRITNGNRRSFGPEISADGGTIAFTSDAGNLVAGDTDTLPDAYLWTRAGGTFRRLSANGGTNVALSGDGSTATFDSGSDLISLRVATGVRTVVATNSSGSVPADLSADGRFIAYATVTEVILWDRTTGLARTLGPSGTRSPPAISADGATVVYGWQHTVDGANRTDVQLWQAGPGTVTTIATGAISGVHPTISDDGTAVAFSTNATHLVPDDTNGKSDLFVWHRPPPVG